MKGLKKKFFPIVRKTINLFIFRVQWPFSQQKQQQQRQQTKNMFTIFGNEIGTSFTHKSQVRLLILILVYEYKKPMRSKDNDLKYFVARPIYFLYWLLLLLLCVYSVFFFGFEGVKNHTHFFIFSSLFLCQVSFLQRKKSNINIRHSRNGGFVWIHVYGVKTVAIN